MSIKEQEGHNPVISITHHLLIKLLVCDALFAIGRIWDSLFSKSCVEEVLDEEEGEHSQGIDTNIVEDTIKVSSRVHIEEIDTDRVVATGVVDPSERVHTEEIIAKARSEPLLLCISSHLAQKEPWRVPMKATLQNRGDFV